MSIYLRIILVVISMLSMMNVMKRVRRFKLQIENSIFWIIFSLLLILVAVFPDPMFWLAELLGIQSPANMVFLFVIFILLIKTFNLTLEISQLRCLKSILDQSWQDFEILCVDDCGQDQSISIIEQMQKEYPQKIKILYGEQNMGLGAARDRGMKAASGEYIAFIDSDDYLKRNFLETYMHAAQKKDADIIVGGYIRDVNGKLSETPIDVNDDTFVWMNVSACTKVYKRKFLEDNHLSFYGVRRYEDEGFMYRCLACHPVVELMAYSGYYYYMNSESITRSSKSDRTGIVKEYFQTVNKLADTVKCDRETQPLLNYCLVSGLTANMLYNGQGCSGKKMKELYIQYNKLLNKIDRDICKNKYIALKYLKSEPAKKRYTTWLILRLRKIGLDRLLFFLVSRI